MTLVKFGIFAVALVSFIIFEKLIAVGKATTKDVRRGKKATTYMRFKVFVGGISLIMSWMIIIAAVTPVLAAFAHLIYKLAVMGWNYI